jgi:hypothetical protein
VLALWLTACHPQDPHATAVHPGDEPGEDEPTPAADQTPYIGCAYDLEESDAGGNVYQRAHSEYDSFGWTALLDEDYEADGVADIRQAWENDVWGNILEYVQNELLDPEPEFFQHGEYDLDGNPVRIEYDEAADGVLESVETYVSQDGLVVSGETDEGADGTVDYAYAYSYDDRRRQVEIVATDGDDHIVWIETITWLEDTDLPASYSVDAMNDDGEVVVEVGYTLDYDDQQRLISLGYFTRDAGELTSSRDTTYTYEGDAPEPASSQTDIADLDGPIRSIDIAWSYDAAWRVVDERETWSDIADLLMHRVYAWTCPPQAR